MTLKEKIVSRLTLSYASIVVVKNLDGFLMAENVQKWLYPLRFVSGSQLALRVDYELNCKDRVEDNTVYLCNQPECLLPDMQQIPQLTFSIADLFPLLPDKQILRTLTIPVLEFLFARQGFKRISLAEQQTMISSIEREIEEQRRKSLEHFTERIKESLVQVSDWSNLQQAVSSISEVVKDASCLGVYENIESLLQPINDKFQAWLDCSYFAELNANPLKRPHSVNKILPHLDAAYTKNDKLALVVVDGLSYWQYLILRDSIYKAGMQTTDTATLAWIPTITMLSRQAIFRGEIPHYDYQQNPQNEKKLWEEHWSNNGFSSYEIQYLYDSDEFVVSADVKRMALVTVELDEKMHSSADNRDLFSLTENWCSRFINKLQALRRAGFTIYITTDHGNLYSHGAGTLSAQEKVFLYKDGSRGKRHLIFTESNQQDKSYESRKAFMPLLKHDKWLVTRGTDCFDKQSSTCITHGGSHWMEVVIPFIKIV